MEPQRCDVLGLPLEIVSAAGIASAVHIPRFGACVDFGHGDADLAATGLVFITHAHIDHLGGIAHHVALRALRGLPPPCYYAPLAIQPRLERLLDAWRDLQEAPLPARCIGLEPGGEVSLRKDLTVRAFATTHRVPSLGYAFLSRHKQLRADFVGTPGHVLAALRKRGEVIEDTHDVVELVVAGDTCIDALIAEPLVRAARRLVMEVTFLDERVSVEDCRAKGHPHLDERVAYADEFRQDALVLCHVSARYRPSEARGHFDGRLPRALRERCTLVLHE